MLKLLPLAIGRSACGGKAGIQNYRRLALLNKSLNTQFNKVFKGKSAI
jgi:hypothetical protein